MLINDTEIVKRIIALAPIASKDETRFHLNAVILEGDTQRRQLFIYATDGHRLVKEVYQSEGPLPELVAGKKYFFYKEHIAMLKQVIKDWGKFDMVSIKLDANENKFTFNDTFSFTVGDESKHGAYPNVDQLIPQNDKGYVTIAFNAKYLLEMNKALRSSNKDEMIKVKFKLEEDKHGNKTTLTPMFIETKDSHSRGVLMPCRVQ